MVLLQFAMFFLIPSLPWSLTIALAYCFGGVINHSLMLGKTEIKPLLCAVYIRFLKIKQLFTKYPITLRSGSPVH